MKVPVEKRIRNESEEDKNSNQKSSRHSRQSKLNSQFTLSNITPIKTIASARMAPSRHSRKKMEFSTEIQNKNVS